MRSFEILERAAPSTGTFVGVRFSEESKQVLVAIQQEFNVPSPLSSDEFHVTLVYSQKPISWTATQITETATPTQWTIFDQRDGARCLVLLLDSPYLHDRWALSREMGATYDFPEYKPHVSLSYNVRDFDYSNIPVPGPLTLIKEYTRPLRP